MEERAYRIGNLDAVIIAQAPKMLPHIEAMKKNIAEDLGTDSERLNIKATTTERLGFEGRGEGIAAQVAVLLSKTV